VGPSTRRDDIARLIDMGVDGIISDRPGPVLRRGCGKERHRNCRRDFRWTGRSVLAPTSLNVRPGPRPGTHNPPSFLSFAKPAATGVLNAGPAAYGSRPSAGDDGCELVAARPHKDPSYPRTRIGR